MSLTKEKLQAYLAKSFRIDGDELDESGALFSSGLLDSFAMVDLVSFIEKEAKIRIPAKDVTLANLDSIAAILRFVGRRKMAATTA